MPRFVIAVSLTVAWLLAEGFTRTDAQQAQPPTGPWHGSGKNGAVATGGQEAMEAGDVYLTDVGKRFADPIGIWRQRAEDVRGEALPSGHYVNEEAPEQVLDWFLRFFGGA